MSDDALFTAPPVVPAGTYPAIVTSVSRVTVTTAEGDKELVRWVVTIPDVGEVDALSSLLFTPKSKARKWANALGVTGDVVAADDLIGCACLAVVAEDDNGYTKLMDLLAPLKSPKAK